MKTNLLYAFIFALMFGAGSLWAAEPAPGPPTLIKNATVYTVTNGTLPGASVLIRDGKIVEVGKNVAAPADAIVIDASGKFLIPGIIDCHSHIAVDGNVNEGTLS